MAAPNKREMFISQSFTVLCLRRQVLHPSVSISKAPLTLYAACRRSHTKSTAVGFVLH
jgi:hypothetical protein